MSTRTEQFSKLISTWTEWAKHAENRRYDIALLKIWIGFEKYISDLFVWYALGRSSEFGYSPSLKIRFIDEEHLLAFLKTEKKYIDYYSRIKELSKHIFYDDPFSRVLFDDKKYSSDYAQIMSIRNYIAHESGDSKIRYIKSCLGDKEFVEPNDFLLKHKASLGKTFYTYYTESMYDMVMALSKKIV